MSDTKRAHNDMMIAYYRRLIEEIKSGKRKRYAYWGRRQKDMIVEFERRLAMVEKSADGTIKTDWRFMRAKKDGFGKMNTFDEMGCGRRDMTRNKRNTSKDTRRYGKRNMRKELDDL